MQPRVLGRGAKTQYALRKNAECCPLPTNSLRLRKMAYDILLYLEYSSSTMVHPDSSLLNTAVFCTWSTVYGSVH